MNLIRLIAALCDPRDMKGMVSRIPKKEKLCLTCAKPHTHNNSYCSAKCCKESQFG